MNKFRPRPGACNRVRFSCKMSQPILYSYYRSSASYRVRIALALKNISYEYVGINILKEGNQQDQYLQLNPLAQVPSLLIDGHFLTQSLPIVEYLDETRTQTTQLLPKDPFRRFQARRLAEIINSGIQPIQNTGVLNKLEEVAGSPDVKTKWSQHWIVKGLTAFEKTIKESSDKFCVGNEVTVADVFLVPQLYNARRFGVDLSQYPKILEVEKACNQLEPFQQAHPDKQPDNPTK